MAESIWIAFIDFLRQMVTLDDQLILLVLLLVIVWIVIDALLRFSTRLRGESGISKQASVKSIDGGTHVPSKGYYSEIQGLIGKPDAVIVEEGFFIPVERKPLSKKLRDRHVAQLLVYMRLVEEFEGKRPPYGYIILGKKARRVRISNSEKRQAWLQQKLDEMREILNKDAEAVPSPSIPKCRSCPVKHLCDHRLEEPKKDSEDFPILH